MTIQLTATPRRQFGITESITETFTETFTGALAGTSRLGNVISSINAYADMSPDLSIRKEVNSWLSRRDRPSLDLPAWCQLFGNGRFDNPALAFVYESFGEYSGLNISQIRPDDSLNTNLKFPLVCWFDWSITFCEDFFQTFGLDLSDRFDEADFRTIGELVNFLIEQVETLSDISVIYH